VWTWVAGFDLLYACQDAEFARGRGLHSIPARIGVAGALRVSRHLHVVTIAALVGVALRADLGPIFWAACSLAAGLLAWEQSLVRAHDLSRVGVAFFTINGWVGVALFMGLAVDMAVFGGTS